MSDIAVGIVLKGDGSGASKAAVQVANDLGKIGTSAKSAAALADDAGRRGFASLGRYAQQAGFQIGDMAVQIASGQGAMRAFVQQGTQLLSMFGPWGAVIGAGVAVVGALASNLDLAGDAADAAANDTDDFAEAHKRLSDAVKTTSENLVSARGDIGSFRVALAEAMEAENQLRLLEQRHQLEALRAERRRPTVAETASEFGLQPDAADSARERLDLDLQIKEIEAEINKGQAYANVLAHQLFAAKMRIAQAEGAAGAGGGRAGAAASTREETSALEQLIAAMRDEASLMALSGRERAIQEQLYRATAAAQRDYAAGLRDVPLLYEDESRAIQETTGRIFDLAQAHRDAAAAAGTYGETARETLDAGQQLAGQLQQLGGIGSSFFAELTHGAGGLSDEIEHLTSRLIDMATELLIIQPLQSMFSGGGFFGGGLFGFIGDLFHEGGVVGSAGMAKRFVPAPAFAGAPRMHSGGFIGPDEVPVIAQKGEIIGWPDDLADIFGGAGGGQDSGNVQVIVTVIDQRGNADSSPVRVTEQDLGKMKKQIIVFISDTAANDINQGGPLSRAMERNYSLRRGGLSR